MPVVPGPGQALGRDRLPLAAQTGLQDVEHADPDGLAELVVPSISTSALVPVLVEQLALLRTSRSQPASLAVASAASTWSRTAASDRRDDQP